MRHDISLLHVSWIRRAIWRDKIPSRRCSCQVIAEAERGSGNAHLPIDNLGAGFPAPMAGPMIFSDGRLQDPNQEIDVLGQELQSADSTSDPPEIALPCRCPWL